MVLARVGRHGSVVARPLSHGIAPLPNRFAGAYLTLSSEHAAEATKILGTRVAIPVHYEGWGHFTQGVDSLRAAFAGCVVSDRLLLVEPGATVEL